MKKVLVFLMCAAMMAAMLCACSSTENSTDNTQDTADATASTAEVTEASQSADFFVETPYCMLKLPAQWKDELTISTQDEDAFVLTFSHGDTRLFDIVIDGTQGDVLGTLKTDEKEVEFRAVVYELDEDTEDYDTCLELQGGVEYISAKLAEAYDFTVGE